MPVLAGHHLVENAGIACHSRFLAIESGINTFVMIGACNGLRRWL
jgi:hypothetical protein